MTKDDVIILPGNVLSRQKRSPQFWACPKNRKKLRGNTRACQARRLAKACQVELMAFVIRGYVHSAHLLAHATTPPLGYVPVMPTSRSGLGNGRGTSRIPFTRPKMEVLAPMPRAR